MSQAQILTRDLGARLGPYVLREILGEGAMGRVYLGEHEQLGRKVAIKVLRSNFVQNEFVVSRFFAEARAVNQISHENIVEITDFVTDGADTAYFVMEYLEGELLADAMRAGPMPAARAARIVLQMASALDAVHALGVVHRDLKPDNVVLVTRGGQADFVKLLDFGAAKINQEVVPGAMPSQPLAIVGTPQYMSPEQATGSPVDHRADIYALGVVLYEALTGANPFMGADTWSTIHNQVKLRPPPIESCESPPLVELAMACLDKDPNSRPLTMVDVETALVDVLESLAPSPSPSRSRTRSSIGRRIAAFFGP